MCQAGCFQSVVLQMKDSVNRTVGVIDADGMVVACSELTCIGEHWSGAVVAVNGADSSIAYFEGRPLSLSRAGEPSSITLPLSRERTNWPPPCAQWRWWPLTAQRLTTRRSMTRLPLSKISSQTTFCWGTSIPRPRSSTLYLRRPGPLSWFASWGLPMLPPST